MLSLFSLPIGSVLGWGLLHLLSTWNHSMYFNVFISPLNSSSDWGLASSPAYAPGLWSTYMHTCEQCVYTGPVNDSSRLHVHHTINHPCAPSMCTIHVLTFGWTQHGRKAVWSSLSTADVGIFQWLVCTASVYQHTFKILMLSAPKEKWKST